MHMLLCDNGTYCELDHSFSNGNYYFLAGPLCLSKHREDRDRRLDDDFITFKKFNRSLEYSCESGEPGILEITPNTTWPDVVYYNSFTQSDMGWKIHIVDSFSKSGKSDAPNVLFNPIILPICFLFKTIVDFHR